MPRSTFFSSARSPRSSGAPPGTAPRKSKVRLIVIIAQFFAMMLLSALSAHAQYIFNGSFETITNPNPPGWTYSGGPVVLQGVPGWWTYNGSPDLFTGSNVPCNYMTTPSACRSPFHGQNYAGISTGIFPGLGFTSEILAGVLTTPISTGMYEVRGRLAMGSARNKPCRIQFQLISSNTPAAPLVVGSMLVTNTNWNLFSQVISLALPGGQTYDRLKIQGIQDANSANNQAAFCFVDSVDVTPVSQDPCSYLTAHAQAVPNPTGGPGCCWSLYIDDNLPAWMAQVYHVRLTSVAPTTLAGPVTNAPATTSTTTLPYTAVWSEASSGPFPNGSQQLVGGYCLDPATNGQTQIIEFLDQNNHLVCRDTIRTDCAGEPHDSCMHLDIQGPLCGPLDAFGNRTYTLTLGVNLSNHVPGFLKFYSYQGTLNPNVLNVPVGNSYTLAIPMVFTDMPPVDNHACIYVEQHVKVNNTDSIICRDTLCFDLPRCAEDCCLNFTKSLSQMHVGVNNGGVIFSGCISAGPNPIKRFSATIVGVQIRTQCGTTPGVWTRVFADIVSGSLGAPLGPPTLIPTMLFSREIVWGGSNYPLCVPFTPCVPFAIQTIFPNPPSGPNCIDTVRVAIRYSFTDCNCVTCDTTVILQGTRRFVPGPWNGGGTTIPLDGLTPYVKPNPGLLNITMSSETQGTLSVTLPTAPHGEPSIRIVGMTLRPVGVPLSSLVEQGTGNGATIDGNTGDISYVLNEGGTRLFDLNYLNDDRDMHIRNLMTFRYVMVGDTAVPPDTLTSDTVEIYTTTPNGAGDVVETTSSSLQDVKTYALHMVASNNMNAAVAAIRLHVNGGATLIAVGPVGDGVDARLSAGVDANNNLVVQVDKDTWTVQNVQAGNTLDPIYLTFAGVGNNTVDVDYTTESEDGSALSTGTASISTPLRVAGVEHESAEMGAALMPIYPNPSAHSATVQFGLKSAGRVSVTVRDVRGAEVLRLIDGEELGVGDHLVPVDTRALPAGTYVVVMDVDGQLFTRPMTIVR